MVEDPAHRLILVRALEVRRPLCRRLLAPCRMIQKRQKPTGDLPVLVAGGGIGGLSVALTLHQIGVPCLVLESVAHLKPLGVGINLQPNAVREIYQLGIGPEIFATIGVQTKEFALVGLNGNDVYSEPRGLLAGYKWPQYSVHRGGLQMLLYRTVVERLGVDAVRTGIGDHRLSQP